MLSLNDDSTSRRNTGQVPYWDHYALLFMISSVTHNTSRQKLPACAENGTADMSLAGGMVNPSRFAHHLSSIRWCHRWSSSASQCAAAPPPAGLGRASAPCRCIGSAARSGHRCLKCSLASRGSKELSFLTLGRRWCYKADIPERKRS